ncbi:hypothetical protein D3C83_263600 [compost metagenome]
MKVVQRLPVKLRLLPHVGEPVLRAGMTATVRVDTGRQRSVGDVVAAIFGGRKEPKKPDEATAAAR